YEKIADAWDRARSVNAPHLRNDGGPVLVQPYRRPGQRFLEDQPDLAKALLRDPSAGFVLKAPQVSSLTRAWNAAADFAFDAPIVGAHNRFPDEVLEAVRKERVKRDQQQSQLVL